MATTLLIEKKDFSAEMTFNDFSEAEDYILSHWDNDADYWISDANGNFHDFRDLFC